jgi:mannose-6-phosphate isomerase-like protein (cupin superfamily)
MSNATIIDLAARAEVDLSTLLTGPLRQARVVTLAAGRAETLSAADREHTVFVLEGTGTATSGTTAVDLSEGTAVTLPLGGAMTISAGDRPLRYFHASLMVPSADGEAGAR